MSTEKYYRSIWNDAIKRLQIDSGLNKASIETWLQDIKIEHFERGYLFLNIADELRKDIFKMRFQEKLENILSDLMRKKITILFNGDEIPKNGNIFTFENFVVGESNKLAHAACLVVAEQPGIRYNPLFIYGGVGLGKTHLMKAIGNRVLQKHPDYIVRYVSCEEFTNELIMAIGDSSTNPHRMQEFRDKYRKCNLLLIDDIQFLAGKERTQEEMFHTFNTLRESGSQIVLSSDRLPQDIPTLEDRLRTRFQWGMITDIKPPDLETRIAILIKKAASDNLTLPMEVLQYIAEAVPSNIRELEGILVRLEGYADLNQTDLNLENSRQYLREILPNGQKKRPTIITVDMIQQEVANYYNMTLEDLLSKKRLKNIAVPRQIAMYLCRNLTDVSYTVLGASFGGKDHTTVMHSVEKITSELEKNIVLQNDIEKITSILKEE